MIQMKKFNFLINIIIYLVKGVALFLVVFFINKPYELAEITEQMRYYSDSFILPGIILIGIFLLSIVASKGAFDGIRYGFKFIVNKLLPTRHNTSSESYYDFKQKLAEKRKEYSFESLIVGCVFLIVGIIFYILYYSL